MDLATVEYTKQETITTKTFYRMEKTIDDSANGADYLKTTTTFYLIRSGRSNDDKPLDALRQWRRDDHDDNLDSRRSLHLTRTRIITRIWRLTKIWIIRTLQYSYNGEEITTTIVRENAKDDYNSWRNMGRKNRPTNQHDEN
jgi:hypothetical protein